MALMARYSGRMKSRGSGGGARQSEGMTGRRGEGGFCYYTRTIGNPGHVKHLTTGVGNHKSRGGGGEGTGRFDSALTRLFFIFFIGEFVCLPRARPEGRLPAFNTLLSVVNWIPDCE